MRPPVKALTPPALAPRLAVFEENRNILQKNPLRPPVYRKGGCGMWDVGSPEENFTTGGCGMWDVGSLEENPTTTPVCENQEVVVGCGMWDLWKRIPQPPPQFSANRRLWDVGCGIFGRESHNYPCLRNQGVVAGCGIS